MRFERVQSILETDPLFKTRLSPRTQVVDTRFGDKLFFSKETVEVTMALHAAGRDAHKVPKNEVLRAAINTMKALPSNSDGKLNANEAVPPVETKPAAPVPPAAVSASAKKNGKTTKVPKSKPAAHVNTAPERQEVKRELKTEKPGKSKKNLPPAKPVVNKNVSAKSTARKGNVTENGTAEPEATVPVPESELPPEAQPLHLPAAYDPRKYPHYDVERAIYSMLLSGLSLSEHYEKVTGFEGRQKRMEALAKEYLELCDSIDTGT